MPAKVKLGTEIKVLSEDIDDELVKSPEGLQELGQVLKESLTEKRKLKYELIIGIFALIAVVAAIIFIVLASIDANEYKN